MTTVTTTRPTTPGPTARPDRAQPIYMDYAATCPVDPAVLDAMLPYFTEKFGNAASRTHSYGWVAEEAVEHARERVAGVIGAQPKEITWTSGATEANNLAIKGVAEYLKDRGNHIVTCVTEHKAVLDPCKYLERKGYRVTYLPVDSDGRLDPQRVAEAITDDTILVSVMFANNETGVVHPVPEIGAICHERGVLFHTDATQAFGKVPVDVQDMHIDLLSMSAHKIYGPKGVGALYMRRRRPRVRVVPLIHGGGHERGNRSGTLPVPLIVGFGRAAQLAAETMDEEAARITALREHLRGRIEAEIPEVVINGSLEHRLPGTLNVSFRYIEGESLIMGLRGVALSSGSACTSASLEPSYVLRAMGLNDELAHSSLRMCVGRPTTREEIDTVVDQLAARVARLREMSPLWEMVQEGIDLNSIQWTPH